MSDRQNTPAVNSLAPPQQKEKKQSPFKPKHIVNTIMSSALVLLLCVTSMNFTKTSTYVPVAPTPSNGGVEESLAPPVEPVDKKDGEFQPGTEEYDYEEVPVTVTYEPNATCFVGGSRVKQMENTILTDIHFITSVTENTTWLETSAQKQIAENKNNIKLCIVSTGFSHLTDSDEYARVLNTWADEFGNISFVFVSLGPVDETLYQGCTNAEIQAFNTAMQEKLNEKWRFVDQYQYLCENGIESENGVNYSQSLNASLLTWILSQSEKEDVVEYVPVVDDNQ